MLDDRVDVDVKRCTAARGSRRRTGRAPVAVAIALRGGVPSIGERHEREDEIARAHRALAHDEPDLGRRAVRYELRVDGLHGALLDERGARRHDRGGTARSEVPNVGGTQPRLELGSAERCETAGFENHALDLTL